MTNQWIYLGTLFSDNSQHTSAIGDAQSAAVHKLDLLTAAVTSKTGPSGSFSGGRGRGRLSHFMTSEQPASEVSQHGSYIPFFLFELHFHDFYWLCRLPLSCSCRRKHMKTAVLQFPLIDQHLQLLFEIKHNLFEFTSLSMSLCSWTRLSLPLSRLAGSGGGICCLQCLFPWLHLEMSEMGRLWLLGASQQNFPKKAREQFQKASSLILQSTLGIPNQWLFKDFKASATPHAQAQKRCHEMRAAKDPGWGVKLWYLIYRNTLW